VPIRRHLIGWAATSNPRTFTFWWAFVFDGSAPAAAFARAEAQRSRSELVLRANDVVYAGDRLAKAARAMAMLRRQ